MTFFLCVSVQAQSFFMVKKGRRRKERERDKNEMEKENVFFSLSLSFFHTEQNQNRKKNKKHRRKKTSLSLSLSPRPSLHLAPSGERVLPLAGAQGVEIVAAGLEVPAVLLVGHARDEALRLRGAGIVRGRGDHLRRLRGFLRLRVSRAQHGVDRAVA